MEGKERRVGTVSRGIRCPIIRQGDDLASIVTSSVLEAAESEGFAAHAQSIRARVELVEEELAMLADLDDEDEDEDIDIEDGADE